MTRISTWYLDVYNVDDAREKILRIIRDKGDERVIYFHGWSGLGASAVLRSIAEVLPSRRTTPELCFDRIIHIDCSEWKSIRALQRKIAEALKLDSSVMDILDRRDEEDDFHGVDENSRNEVVDVSEKINHILKDSRFMVIFHSGSDDETDLNPLGVPYFGKFTKNIMIWTYRRRILAIKELEHHELIQKLRYTHLLVHVHKRYLASGQFYAILCKEAAIIVDEYECMRGVNPVMVADCYMYKLFMHRGFHNQTKSDWVGGLASNYWICDGILQEDIAHEVSNALHREINWECDDDVLEIFNGNVLVKFQKYFLVVKDNAIYEEGSYRWISITSRDTELRGMQTVPQETTSFFLTFQISNQPLALPNGLFEHCNKLGVLILCCCTLNFASPPFRKCQSLRFLGLDRCTEDKTGEGEDHTEWACLHSLLVLNLHYTDWNEILCPEKMDFMTNLMELSIEGVWCWQYTSRLQWRLPNLQRLRVIKPTRGPEISTDPSNPFLDETKLESNFFLNKTKLEILDLSGNSEMKILPNSLSKTSNLKVLVLDGCNGLENVVVPDGLPHLLKSFSFDGYGSASHWAPTVELPLKHKRPSTAADKKGVNVSKISLAGCTQLENLFVRGLSNLVELDLSGTRIKILDFKTMVMEVPSLKRLFLLGCEHLRAITWSKGDFTLDMLCIDTRVGITDCSRPSVDRNNSFLLQVHAILADARLARSLRSLLSEGINYVYLNILVTSSPVYSGSVQLEEPYKKKKKIGLYSDQVGLLQFVPAGRYSDLHGMVGDTPMRLFPKPPTNLDRHVEIAKESHGLESSLDTGSIADIMKNYAESLHIHDVSISGNMPSGTWDMLKQCRMERCPKLDAVFPSHSSDFKELKIFWASDLLMARWIVGMGERSYGGSFRNLQHLHLHSCPRLQFVLPVWHSSFPSLKTLHIIHCGNLKHVFVLDKKYPEEITIQGVKFPNLTTIHLHDLPVLRQMCEKVKMVAPALETIRIRGCWGLQRLPVVGPRSGSVKKPSVEIEKDAWDALEWDDGRQPDHFEAPLHSRYYKKKLPRVSLLR